MNKLDLLVAEKEDLIRFKSCIDSGLKYLNVMRDSDYHTQVFEMSKSIEKRIKYLDKDIEETKKCFDGIIETEISKGHILVAKRKSDGKDLFLRYIFIPERVQNDNWNNAFIFDWVEKLEEGCFMTFDKISTGKHTFSKELFRKVYSYHKKNLNLENGVKDLKLREVDKEVKHNYIFNS